METYCPHCGSAATYTASKPTKCPTCKRDYASAFKVEVVEEQPRPAPKPKTPRFVRMTKGHQPMGPRDRGVGQPNTIRPFNPDSVPEGIGPPPPDDDEPFEDTDASKDEISALAGEIAASHDTSGIRISIGEDAPIRLGRDGPASERQVDSDEWKPRPRGR